MRISVVKKMKIAYMTQQVVFLNAPIDGIMSLKSHPRVQERHAYLLSNGIVEIKEDKPLPVWIANFSKSPRTIPKQMAVWIAASTPAEIYYPAIKAKKERTTGDLRSPHNLVFEVHATVISRTSTFSKATNQKFENLKQHEEHEKSQSD